MGKFKVGYDTALRTVIFEVFRFFLINHPLAHLIELGDHFGWQHIAENTEPLVDKLFSFLSIDTNCQKITRLNRNDKSVKLN